MFARLVFLISLLVSTSVFADDNSPEYLLNKEPHTSVTGFVYNTTFSQSNWHDNRSVAAVNLDFDYGNFAARAQIGTYDSVISRGTLEYSTPIGEQAAVIYQVGRFSRVTAFNDNIVDAPASWNMAIPPFSGYSYRMINGSFALMDGHRLLVPYRTDAGNMITFKASYGRSVISQEEMQREAFKSYNPDIQLRGEHGAYDLALHYETKHWHFYTSQSFYEFSSSTSSSNPRVLYAVNNFKNITYTLNRAGVKYDNSSWFVRSELIKGMTIASNVSDKETSRVDAVDHNIVIGKYLDDCIVYGGMSYGKNRTSDTRNYDKFVGVTYKHHKITISLDYHIGEGHAWMKYGVPKDADHRWRSWVISTTYRF